ncbi:SPOR domain-containing protein [Pseudoalteromonas sp. 2CM39R]|uniref:SPOR domain-containing protein n=1 Tax=Pseudoalteromonas sp. 2CM39R TaxID=2929856 RepID=UPI0020BEB2AA|nr:SPOR domain-containing protein [Pseudoalteromonas sp. 2CM39R]MCK8127104.1 SPOR domain-containing protein [Pseudoalteromonas sp. 2CM39R]
MVFTNFQNLKKVWLVLLVTPIIGCQSMSEPQVSEENLVKISQQELIELRQSHQQFQAMKPELERLLTIESELTLLTEQLTLLNAQQTEPEKTKESSVTTPQFIAEPTAKFALQLASVTELPRLTARLAEIKKQAPALFNGQFIANVESVTVNGSTFHRLKIGAYQQKQQAANDCKKLASVGVACLVSHYVQNPLDLSQQQ